MNSVPWTPYLAGERLVELSASAKSAGERSISLIDSSRVRRAESSEARRRALNLRLHRRWNRSYFCLEGLVEDAPVAATFGPDGLLAHDELLQRARLVVELGEQFEREDGTSLAASLERPAIAVALTLIRACDRPLQFHLGLGQAVDAT